MTTFNHGNRLRPEKEAYEVKKARSRRVYAEKNLLIDPYWLNEKLLRKYYNLYGPKKYISPLYVVKESGQFSYRGFRCLNVGFFLLKIVVFVFLGTVV